MSVLIGSLGPVVTREHAVQDFTRIKLRGLGTLLLVQGDREAVEVDAPDNLHEHIAVRVRDDTLTLALQDVSLRLWNGQLKLLFRVYVRNLRALSSSGAGAIRAGRLSTSDLDITCSGAAKVDLESLQAKQLNLSLSGAGRVLIGDVTCETVRVDLHGAGNIHIHSLSTGRFVASLSGAGRVLASGMAQEQDLAISGAGALQLEELHTRNTRVSLSGAGKAFVHTSDELEASVSGVGKVEYSGHPRSVRQRSSGFGKIIER